jgi:hypothetical protein
MAGGAVLGKRIGATALCEEDGRHLDANIIYVIAGGVRHFFIVDVSHVTASVSHVALCVSGRHNTVHGVLNVAEYRGDQELDFDRFFPLILG